MCRAFALFCGDYSTPIRMQSTASPLAFEDSAIVRIILRMAMAACGVVPGNENTEPEKKRSLFGMFR